MPRSEGGRGLLDLLNLHNKQKASLRDYFLRKRHSSHLHSAIVQADKGYSPLNLANDETFTVVTNEEKRLSWSQKPLHGRHAHELAQPYVDSLASNAWLTCGTLFPETEGFMCAIQDQVINTRNYKKYIIRDGTTNDSCRRCGTVSESIQHIISGCRSLVSADYKDRHDSVARILHLKLAQKYSFQKENTPYYEYTPEKVLENENAKIYWDRAIITDRTIPHNRPDIVVLDKKLSEVCLVDIAVPESGNLQNTYEGKLRKYADLLIELKELWHVERVSVVPVVISATGLIPRNLKENLKKLGVPENIFIAMQKAVVLSTCNLVRKFLGNC